MLCLWGNFCRTLLKEKKRSKQKTEFKQQSWDKQKLTQKNEIRVDDDARDWLHPASIYDSEHRTTR
jgi:hypothetical protein